MQPAGKTLTSAEYLSAERAAPERSELILGEPFAVAGDTFEHDVIAGNVITELNIALRDRPCVVFPSDMEVKVTAASFRAYVHSSVLACNLLVIARHVLAARA